MAEFPVHRFERGAGSEHVPEELWRISEAPERLFVQGAPEALSLLSQLPARGLAIVGTRSPQPRCLQLVRNAVGDLRGAPLIVISGLARGIDAEAHGAALDNGLPTIAVLASGLDLSYPRENEALRDRILRSGGLIVSEHPSGTPAQPHYFLQRNRIIAGWSKAVWIAAAPARSGALNTAKWARDQYRTCFATPCFPGDSELAGNQDLIDRHTTLPFWGVQSLGEVWIELASWPPRKRASRGGRAEVRELSRQVSELQILNGSAQVGELIEWSTAKGWSPEKFFATLQRSIDQGAIIDVGGLLISSQSERH